MMMKYLLGFAASAAVAVLAAAPASAHRQWLLPSSTIVSGDDVWVTVDAAVSNDLFYFEHQPLRLDAVKVWAPDGSETPIENAATGRYRSTFDVHLTQRGTWRIASVSDGLVGSYELDGKTERLPRGTTRANLAERLPAGAVNVKTAESSSRNEIFVTVGEPTTNLFTPTGKGIELAPVTHPNDLFAGETAIFQFLLDGKAAAGLTVTVIPGGIRYRDQLGQIDLVTDAAGKVEVTWPEAGLYWLNVTTPRAGGGEAAAPQRRASYVTTLEVMAP
ncbi:DUF4198 domain-containing protein [Sphingopyxis flava]|uniref:GH25 family protein n=1 Tax=Sphingopyxis flava TaxID=1507287 RepID=A0A1T5D641_9SPHN|nr:DUF4198 domain-containing protein [Sphingopyxis flava]SKB67061.1 protein of unknown function [Sphingopyxis flava]